jgi:hypothetical protein
MKSEECLKNIPSEALHFSSFIGNYLYLCVYKTLTV